MRKMLFELLVLLSIVVATGLVVLQIFAWWIK